MSQLARQLKMVDTMPDAEDTWNNLGDSTVMQKYQAAAAFTNEALRLVLSSCKAGAMVSQLCKIGDDHILLQVSKVFVKGNVEKGIAFPTCISVNNIVCNYSPLEADSSVLKVGDIVKVELGAHVDGYAVTAGHTIVLTENPMEPVTGRAADVICAAYMAAEAAVRLVKVGAESSEVSRAVNSIAQSFGVSPVEGTSSHLMKRFLLEADQAIPNSFNPETNDFTFGENEVISLNIVLSTGTGLSAQESSSHPTTLLQRDVNAAQGFKLKSSRAAFNAITRTFGVFPFSARALVDMDTAFRLGLPELIKSGVLVQRPVFTVEEEIEHGQDIIVAQFKVTVALLPGGQGTIRLSAPLNAPYVHSTRNVDPDFEKLLKQDVKVAKAKAPLTSAGANGMDLS
ncbi:hypothetical protein HDU81_008001 [Chytriomyces hyalinus]|nr:hypothetical protein HDU81_008001 [Chytriomyces hyalinus]